MKSPRPSFTPPVKKSQMPLGAFQTRCVSEQILWCCVCEHSHCQQYLCVCLLRRDLRPAFLAKMGRGKGSWQSVQGGKGCHLWWEGWKGQRQTIMEAPNWTLQHRFLCAPGQTADKQVNAQEKQTCALFTPCVVDKPWKNTVYAVTRQLTFFVVLLSWRWSGWFLLIAALRIRRIALTSGPISHLVLLLFSCIGSHLQTQMQKLIFESLHTPLEPLRRWWLRDASSVQNQEIRSGEADSL